jgi:hypothetical protein
MKHSLKIFFLIALTFVVALNLLPHVPARSGNETCYGPPPHRCLILSLNEFESNHTLMASVHFEAEVFARGGAELGGVGLTISDQPEEVFHSSNTYVSNGTYLDQEKAIARWTYNIVVNFQGLGSSDFYPYDSWLFSVTVSSPFLSLNETNSSNTYVNLQNLLTDWVEECPNGCFVPSYQNSIVTTFVLSRTPEGLLFPLFMFRGFSGLF